MTHDQVDINTYESVADCLPKKKSIISFCISLICTIIQGSQEAIIHMSTPCNKFLFSTLALSSLQNLVSTVLSL